MLDSEDAWPTEPSSEDFAGTSIYTTLKLTSPSGELSPPLLQSIGIYDYKSSLWEVVANGTSTKRL